METSTGRWTGKSGYKKIYRTPIKFGIAALSTKCLAWPEFVWCRTVTWLNKGELKSLLNKSNPLCLTWLTHRPGLSEGKEKRDGSQAAGDPTRFQWWASCLIQTGKGEIEEWRWRRVADQRLVSYSDAMWYTSCCIKRKYWFLPETVAVCPVDMSYGCSHYSLWLDEVSSQITE